ncbi:GIP [Symbiodinium sp. CCMP2592]|nr:GIP [Symbiodinium sp. CCMP2592]
MASSTDNPNSNDQYDDQQVMGSPNPTTAGATGDIPRVNGVTPQPLNRSPYDMDGETVSPRAVPRTVQGANAATERSVPQTAGDFLEGLNEPSSSAPRGVLGGLSRVIQSIPTVVEQVIPGAAPKQPSPSNQDAVEYASVRSTTSWEQRPPSATQLPPTPLLTEAMVQRMREMERAAPLLYPSGGATSGRMPNPPSTSSSDIQAEVRRQLSELMALRDEEGRRLRAQVEALAMENSELRGHKTPEALLWTSNPQVDHRLVWERITAYRSGSATFRIRLQVPEYPFPFRLSRLVLLSLQQMGVLEQLKELRSMAGNPEIRGLQVEEELLDNAWERVPIEGLRQQLDGLRALVATKEPMVRTFSNSSADQDRLAKALALLDSGATHAVIPYDQSLGNLESVPVTLAGDERQQWLKTKGGTLVVPPSGKDNDKSPKPQTILPLGSLVETLGCTVEWSKRKGLKVSHPTLGALNTGLSSNHCPLVQEDQALTMIAELESKRLESFRDRIQDLECQIEHLQSSPDPTQTLRRYVASGDRGDALQALIAQPYLEDVPMALKAWMAEGFESTSSETGWKLMKNLPLKRAARRALLQSDRWIVHLCSGEPKCDDPVACWCEERGFRFLPVDIREKGGKGWDLTKRDGVWRVLLWAAAAGKVSGILSSPPMHADPSKEVLKYQDKFLWSLASVANGQGIPFLSEVSGIKEEPVIKFNQWSARQGERDFAVAQQIAAIEEVKEVKELSSADLEKWRQHVLNGQTSEILRVVIGPIWPSPTVRSRPATPDEGNLPEDAMDSLYEPSDPGNDLFPELETEVDPSREVLPLGGDESTVRAFESLEEGSESVPLDKEAMQALAEELATPVEQVVLRYFIPMKTKNGFGQQVLHRIKRPADGAKQLMERWINAQYACPHRSISDGHVLITAAGNLEEEVQLGDGLEPVSVPDGEEVKVEFRRSTSWVPFVMEDRGARLDFVLKMEMEELPELNGESTAMSEDAGPGWGFSDDEQEDSAADLALLYEEDLIENGSDSPDLRPQPSASSNDPIPSVAAGGLGLFKVDCSFHEEGQQNRSLDEEYALHAMLMQSVWDEEEDDLPPGYPVDALGTVFLRRDSAEDDSPPGEEENRASSSGYSCRMVTCNDDGESTPTGNLPSSDHCLPHQPAQTTSRIGVPTTDPLKVVGQPGRTLSADPQVCKIDESFYTKDVENILDNLTDALKVVHNVSPDGVRKHLQKWIPAARAEVNALETMKGIKRLQGSDVTKAMSRPDVQVLPAKTVFTVKPGADTAWFRRKCRVVGCGNFEEKDPGLELYAGGVPAEALRTILVESAVRKFLAFVTDIKNAFLLAPLPLNMAGRILLKPPRLLEQMGITTHDECWEVCKAVYGLRQSPKWWSDYRDSVLKGATWEGESGLIRLQQSNAEGNVWKMLNSDDQVIGFVIIYVDDMMFLTTKPEAEKAYAWLRSMWQCTPLEEATLSKPITFLGVEISIGQDTEGRQGFLLGQRGYIDELLRMYSLEPRHRTPVPREWVKEAPEHEEGYTPETLRRAQRITGELLWLTQRTRVDAAYTVSLMGSWCTKAPEHVIRLGQRLLHFLGSTKDWKLSLIPVEGEKRMVVYTDASFAPYGSHSITGVLITYHGRSVVWKAKKQALVSLSTAESELIAACEGVVMGQSSESLILELTSDLRTKLLLVDNLAAIALVEGSGSQRTRHLRVRSNFVKDQVERKELEVDHCPGEQQLADLLTKILAGPRHQFLACLIGLSVELPPMQIATLIRGAAPTVNPELRANRIKLVLLVLIMQMIEAEAVEDDELSDPLSLELSVVAIMMMLSILFVWESGKYCLIRCCRTDGPRIRSLRHEDEDEVSIERSRRQRRQEAVRRAIELEADEQTLRRRNAPLPESGSSSSAGIPVVQVNVGERWEVDRNPPLPRFAEAGSIAPLPSTAVSRSLPDQSYTSPSINPIGLWGNQLRASLYRADWTSR